MTQTIWQLIDSRGFGGIETHIRILSESLNERGYKSQIILTDDYGEHPVFDDAALGSTVIRCRGLKDLTIRAVKERPAVIHGHGYKASLFAKLLGFITQSHAVSTYHSGEMGAGKAAIYNIIDRFTARLSSGISVSDEIAETLSYPSTRIDNFIDEYSVAFMVIIHEDA